MATKDTRLFPNVELEVLRSVVLICDYKSAKAAAEKSGLSIFKVTRQIADLERQLDVKLFDRLPRGLRPTAQGLIYAEAANNIMRELERAGKQLEPVSGEVQGQVRVFISEVLVDEVLMKEIRWLTRKYPKIRVKVTIAFADQTRDALSGNEADIGFIFGLGNHPDIEILARHEHPLVAVVAPEHALAKARTRVIKPEILLDPQHRLALPPLQYRTRRIFDSMLSHVTREQLANSIQLELNSLQHLKWYAQHSEGVSVLPTLLAQREIKSGKLVAIYFEDSAAAMTNLSLCRPRHRVLNTAAQILLTRLTDVFMTFV